MNKVFFNGNIHIMDDKKSIANAMLIENDYIKAVGTSDQIFQLADADDEKIDLAGKTVVPGFNDSHLHLMGIGLSLEQVLLNDTKSVEELVNKTKEFLNNNEDIKWVLGRGWNQSNYPNQEMPTRVDLDKIIKDKPVVLRRTCGHVSVVNTKALELAGLMDKPVEQIAGGYIDLDKQGLPTGILREKAAGIVSKLIPESDIKDYKRQILKGAKLANSYGLTSVQTDDLGSPKGMKKKLEAYKQAFDSGLKLRVNHQIRLSETHEIDQYFKLRNEFVFPENTITYGPLKLMTDGSLGGRTAYMQAPYTDDPTTSGVEIMSQEEINEMYKYAYDKGMQLSAHAIGDGAIQKLLNSFRLVLKDNKARPRIIHAQITNWHILEQMKNLGVVCDIQPIFVPTDMKIVKDRLGQARASQSYLWKTMRELGIYTAGGSDSPVESPNPILGISAAVNRTDLDGKPVGGFMPDEKLSVHEAVDLFTNGSAFAEKKEKIKGSLEKDKLADFVVLSQDIFTIDPLEIKNVEVEATYIGGQLVYSNC